MIITDHTLIRDPRVHTMRKYSKLNRALLYSEYIQVRTRTCPEPNGAKSLQQMRALLFDTSKLITYEKIFNWLIFNFKTNFTKLLQLVFLC